MGVLAVTRLGIITPKQLAENRRYAILVIAILAMLLPGTDPITMLLSMLPLILLFELSLVLARILGNARLRTGDRSRRREPTLRPRRPARLPFPCSSTSAAGANA